MRRNRLIRPILCMALAMSALPHAKGASGEQDPHPGSRNAAISEIEERLREFIALHTRELAGRVDVRFGPLRGAYSPCDRLEPFVPPGARLWGRANIGLRCAEGVARWTAWLPVEIQVHVPALVTTRSLHAGQAIDAEDYQIREVDITREPKGVLIDPSMADSRVAARPIASGTVLRSDMLRARPAVSVGDAVRIQYVGSGFSISTDGKALASAGSGQSVRVQVESGRILSGIARDGRIVEVR